LLPDEAHRESWMTPTRWRGEAGDLETKLREQGDTPTVVAFQGERGAYGHLAIERLWGGNAQVLPCLDFGVVIAALDEGKATHGVLPVHNAIIGEIERVRDAIATADLEVLGETWQEVEHCLLGHWGSTLDELTEVFSHPAALAQCRLFFDRHRGMVPREWYDTAGAARDVAARALPHEGAIAAQGCAALYGLQVLARGVGDRGGNATRFAVVRWRVRGC